MLFSMTSEEHKIHFPTIEEQLESKNVVTFKWLSRKCKIHSTIAKQLLKEFVDVSDKNKYSVTYVVFCKDANGNLVINLTDSSDINNAADGCSVIDTQIYSIECGSSDISTDVIYNEEKLSFQLEQMDLSSISYPSKVSKNPNLRRQSSSVSNAKQNNVDTSEKPSTSDVKVVPTKEKGNKLNFVALPKSKNEEKNVNKNEQKPDAKNEDKSLKKSSVKAEPETKTKSTKTGKATSGKGSLSMLFQNHRVKRTSPASTSSSNEDKESKEEAESLETNSEDVEETQSEKSQPAKRSSPVKVNKNQAKTTKKNAAKSKKKPEKKKLKRVKAAFESSSDESENDENSSNKVSPFDEMEEEPQPEPEPQQPAEPEPATCVVQGKKRKRKVVSKSVMGDDGFFYTEKEVVYESCDSDDNDENDPNVNQESSNKRLKTSESSTNAVSKTKTVSPTAEKTSMKNQKAKTKQASIMNFFKKS